MSYTLIKFTNIYVLGNKNTVKTTLNKHLRKKKQKLRKVNKPLDKQPRHITTQALAISLIPIPSTQALAISITPQHKA